MCSRKLQALVESKAERERAWYRIGEWVFPALNALLGLGDDVISVSTGARTTEEFPLIEHTEESEANFEIAGSNLPQVDREFVEAEAESPEEASDSFRALTNHPDLTWGKQMLAKQYPKQRFVIGPSLVPRSGRMLLTAENGTGKSIIALYMAACILLGKPLFGFTQTKKEKDFGKPIFPTVRIDTALYLDYEIPEANRAEERLKPLARLLGEGFAERIFFPKAPSDFRLMNGSNNGSSGAFDRLLELVGDAKPGLLVIDPLSSTHSLDENSNQIKQALNNIDRLIDHSGATVILVHHESPKKLRDQKGHEIEKDAKERVRGHSALTDWADVHLSIEEIKEKAYHESKNKILRLTWGKTRYARKPQEREIEIDFETMEIKPRRRGED